MNKQLKQFIDICTVGNAFQTKNQQTLVKSCLWYFLVEHLPGFSWLLCTSHRLAPGVGTPGKPAAGEYVRESFLTFVKSSDFSRQIAEEEAAWPSG